MKQYIKIVGNYFRVYDIINEGHSLTLDRPVQPPRGLVRRLLWEARNQWCRVQWEKAGTKRLHVHKDGVVR